MTNSHANHLQPNDPSGFALRAWGSVAAIINGSIDPLHVHVHQRANGRGINYVGPDGLELRAYTRLRKYANHGPAVTAQRTRFRAARDEVHAQRDLWEAAAAGIAERDALPLYHAALRLAYEVLPWPPIEPPTPPSSGDSSTNDAWLQAAQPFTDSGVQGTEEDQWLMQDAWINNQPII